MPWIRVFPNVNFCVLLLCASLILTFLNVADAKKGPALLRYKSNKKYIESAVSIAALLGSIGRC